VQVRDAREGVEGRHKQLWGCCKAVGVTRSRRSGSSDVRSTAWEDDAHRGVLRRLSVSSAYVRVSNYDSSDEWCGTRPNAMAGASNRYGCKRWVVQTPKSSQWRWKDVTGVVTQS
jgi:hypothetical protein